MSAHITGSPPAHLVIVYDAGADLIRAAHADATVDAAVAGALAQAQRSVPSGPETFACDQQVAGAVRLNRARFRSTAAVVAADDAERRAMSALFADFLATTHTAGSHAHAVLALEDAARHFIARECWRDRSDSQPLLLDASIDGERAGGVVSVMGNGGESWGLAVFPDGGTYSAVVERDEAGMPPDGVLSCVLDRRAFGDLTVPAVEMAVAIRKGEAEPASGREVHLLEVALRAATKAPAVGDAKPASGEVRTPEFEARYVLYDIEGAQRGITEERATPPGEGHRREVPELRFGVLPRAVADAVVSPQDELPYSLLAALPAGAPVPAVFLRFGTPAASREFVDQVEGGNYLGVSAHTTPMGMTLRLIGLSEPILLGVKGTRWPPLRGFMRRREEAGGLHLLAVASRQGDDMDGLFACVLPQPARPAAAQPRRDTKSKPARPGPAPRRSL